MKTYQNFVDDLNSISNDAWQTNLVASVWVNLSFLSPLEGAGEGEPIPLKVARDNVDRLCGMYGVKVAVRQHQAIFQSEFGEFTVTI
jgi:hypothetical protein